MAWIQEFSSLAPLEAEAKAILSATLVAKQNGMRNTSGITDFSFDSTINQQ